MILPLCSHSMATGQALLHIHSVFRGQVSLLILVLKQKHICSSFSSLLTFWSNNTIFHYFRRENNLTSAPLTLSLLFYQPCRRFKRHLSSQSPLWDMERQEKVNMAFWSGTFLLIWTPCLSGRKKKLNRIKTKSGLPISCGFGNNDYIFPWWGKQWPLALINFSQKVLW